MRACRRTIHHPLGPTLKTPLLIPSFSSKGFELALRSDKTQISEVSQYLEVFASRLTDSFLVSAYDLHHKLLDKPGRLSTRYYATSLWANAQMLFIDSGLYERRIGADSDEPLKEMRLPQEWDEDLFKRYAKRLPKKAPIALVNWDRYEDYRTQIDAAQAFFAEHKSFLSVFLLKPENEGAMHELTRLTEQASRLAAFKVIAVTEKEFGDSVLERMTNVAKLRELLDREEVDAPIHVFGALDPLYTPLYYAAGAEIFDGLSWLRYLWQDGVAVHRASVSVLFGNVEKDQRQAIEIAQNTSLDKIANLRRRLINFHQEDGDWSVFDERAEVLENAFRDMESNL
jgi:hypothetical protein